MSLLTSTDIIRFFSPIYCVICLIFAFPPYHPVCWGVRRTPSTPHIWFHLQQSPLIVVLCIWGCLDGWLLHCASGDVSMVDCCIVHLGMSLWLIAVYFIWGCRDGWLLYSSSGVVSMVDCRIASGVSIVLLFSLYSAINEVHIWYISTIYAYRWFNI